MAGKRVSVKIQPQKGSEEAFFLEQDQQKLRELLSIKFTTPISHPTKQQKSKTKLQKNLSKQ